jgi:hypothetical protein
MFTTTIISALNDNADLKVRSQPFAITETALADIGIVINKSNLVPDSRTGKLILQGGTEMDLLQAAWPAMIEFMHFKEVRDLQFRHYQWHSHSQLDQTVEIQFDIVKFEPVLDCYNVWWNCSLVDSASQSMLCSYQRCQRWYTA